MYFTSIYADILIYTGIYQVKLIKAAIDKVKTGSCLLGLPHVADPSNDIVDVLIQCMDWTITSRQSRIPEAELPEGPELQEKAVAFLDLLQWNLPDKTGETGKWNFEKAHSILHKVREISLWGNSDNTSCQGPEICICISAYVHTSTYNV
jgi:hypothetical protein